MIGEMVNIAGECLRTPHTSSVWSARFASFLIIRRNGFQG
jgi:hypothetical protein